MIRNIILSSMVLGLLAGCLEEDPSPPTSASGAKKLTVKIQKDAAGLTVEQKNVRDRLLADNKPGAIKHLYVISAFSGDVLIYSTVRGKVTSSGKRLTPNTVVVGGSKPEFGRRLHGFDVNVNGIVKETSEVLQDDGTYGTSSPYLFWWDALGKYHQHYVSGGQILHISDQPIRVPKPIIEIGLDDE
jgi:hypothetical protein